MHTLSKLTCRKKQQCSESIRVPVMSMPASDPILTDTHRTGSILALVLSQNSRVWLCSLVMQSLDSAVRGQHQGGV